jgi:hypothetical protein
MQIIPPNRVAHTYVQNLAAAPSEVLPLLCPVREAEWIRGWDPLLVLSRSGVVEADCVFLTEEEPENAVWYVTRHEEASLEMIRITPGVTACRVNVELSAVASGTEAKITYMHTSLGEAGDEFLETFTAPYYEQFMRDWESRLNHFLRTGQVME